MNTTCGKCEFDLLQLDLSLELKGGYHAIFCPVCGNCVEESAEFPGVFYDENEKTYVIWKLNSQRQREATSGQKFSECFGLSIEGKSLNPYDICYPRVLVFQHESEVVAPFTAVKPEFYHYLKPYAEVSGQWVPPKFRFQPSLRGDFSPTIQLSALTSQTEVGSEPKKYRNGTALNLWPNFRREGWRNYFVYFVSTDPNVKVQSLRIIGEHQEQKTFSGPVPRGEVDFVPNYIEICVTDSLGSEFWSCYKVEFNDGETMPAAFDYQDRDSTALLSVDFGTSNTCFAINLPEDDTIRITEFHDRTKRIVKGLYVGDSITFTWFPEVQEGEQANQLPSELIFATETKKISGEIHDFRPIVNYTIPPPTRYREGEEKYVLGGFKWERSLSNSPFRPLTFDLQYLYLTLAFRIALAEIVSNPRCQRFDRMELVATCPLSFSTAQRDQFREVLRRVQEEIEQKTGIKLLVKKMYDESHAGAAGSGEVPGTNETVYVDIGGGTTDIGFFRFEDIDNKVREQAVYLDSMQYAGDNVWKAITKSDLTTWPLIRFEREARFRTAKSIFDDHDLEPFCDQLNNLHKARRCVQRFIDGQVEFIVRMIGARQIAGAESPFLDGELGLYLLGNGWRFVEVLFEPRGGKIGSEIADHVKQLVQSRLNLYKIQSPPLVVTYPTKDNVSAKTTVAIGAATLYFGEKLGKVLPEPEFTLRSFLGSDLVVTTSQKEIINWSEPVPYALTARSSVQCLNYQIHDKFEFESEQADSSDIQAENLLRPLLTNLAGQTCIGKNIFAYYLECWYTALLLQ